MLKIQRILLLFAVIVLAGYLRIVNAQQTPRPADLLEFENPKSLNISPDGDKVLVQTKRAVVDSNEYVSNIWLIQTNGSGVSTKLDLPKGVKNLQWLPDSKHVAYMAPSEKGKQIWKKEIGADTAYQITETPGGIRNFSLSPNGKRIAFTSMKYNKNNSNNENDKYKHSIEVDLKTFRAQKLFSNRLAPRVPPQSQLWIKDLKGGAPSLVSDTLTVGGYKWSPTSNRLAFIAKPVSILKPGIPTLRIDILICNVETNNLQLVKKGYQGQQVYENTIAYSYPFWSPSGSRLGFVRLDRSKRWSTTPDVGIYTFKTGETRYIINGKNQGLEDPDFHWLKPDHIFVEYTQRARNGLFRVSVDDGSVSPVVNSNNHFSSFSFSNKGQRAVWIKQSVGMPPELFTARQPFGSSRKISDFNQIGNIWLPKAEYIEWKSTDGTTVQGWLIKPRMEKGSNPPPLLTLIHGGPSYTVMNKFQAYLPQWPYPVQIFASKGYAVFMPNYRGTDSFGQDYQQPISRGKEPVQDVITGIRYLISKGWADKDQLGIMGHSHGVFVGPLAIAKKPMFKAASFAEGFGNALSLYGQNPGWGMKEVFEYEMVDSSPYKEPERYLDISPAFLENFTQTTPTLFEYGQESNAYQGVEIGKALWHQDTPHKFVIYPEGGHAIRRPAIQIESIQRNLNWFKRWIPVNTVKQ